MAYGAGSGWGKRAMLATALVSAGGVGAGLAAPSQPPAKPRPAPAAAPPAIASASLDFKQQIQPLLTARCVACHGAKNGQSGLRLDRKTLAFQGGDSGPAIVPGKSGESELFRRITSTDPKHRMPPGAPLPPAEIARLKAWIDAGAAWPDDPASPTGTREASGHWSFRPIMRPPLPKVKNPKWAIHPVDGFILARLEAKGLRPSPPADRPTLIRRASLDLIGLPPTPEEVDAFVADQQPGAYERVVDHLLASPHYGERWGRFWLDQARYADSNGYTIDSARQIWKYRDWVIDALNRDLPFDQFTIEQIAGDMLPNATQDQIIATGFHRNTLFNEEGGTDREQFRVESVVDRVATTGSVFLGLTVGCAQCHTHKYDPITQREYYQLYAFLNNADEPKLDLPTPAQTAELKEIRASLAIAQKTLADYDREAAKRPQTVPATAAGAAWNELEATSLASRGGATLTRLADRSVLVTGEIPANDSYTVSVTAPGGPIRAIRLEALTHESIPGTGPGLTAHGNFVLNEFELTAGPDNQRVTFASATADYAQKTYPVEGAIDGDPKTGWGVSAPNCHIDRQAVFTLKEPLLLPAGTRLTFTLRHLYNGQRYSLGRFRLATTATVAAAAPAAQSPELMKALATAAEKRTAEQKALVAAEVRKADPERARLNATVEQLQAREKKLVASLASTLVMRERETPRETTVMIRGDFLRKGAVVQPGVPAVLPPLPHDVEKPNRLHFARWLVSRENPLTPRVTVNRIWQQHFGIGLVETENDFGKQGTPPSHPELLDYLASTFANPSPQGLDWSLKKLHRLIVTSATYRQSSKMRPELREVDPSNRLLARMPRMRLEAESVRDVALAASGLLSRKIGGPSVFPPQPAGLDAFTQSKKNWTASQGEDRYRRGLYTFMWRSSPYAFFATLDAPNGNVTCTRRARSTTPLSALMLANDQSIFEMAQGLAVRILKEGPPSDSDRIRWAFRRCLSREPSTVESGRLLDYYRSQAASFTTGSADAAKVAPKDRPQEVPVAEAAAWTSVARVLLNLDEFITRE